MAIADRTGTVLGGHVVRGCAVHTTAEIVIAEVPGFGFARRFDPETGYPELVIDGRRRP
jgi:predicted DNA-binding protein with PD1-like motif